GRCRSCSVASSSAPRNTLTLPQGQPRKAAGRASQADRPPRFTGRHEEYASARAGERAVDHVDRVLDSVERNEGSEARPFLLPEQDLIEHVEPIERYAGLAVFRFDLAGAIQKRLAPAHLIDNFLD